MENRTDKELMKLVADRNTLALKILYRRYEMPVFNFVLRCTGSREIAQELIQETFTRIWFAAHTFDQKKGNFKGWLYTIALNITRNEMSKKEYSYHFLDPGQTPGYHGRQGEGLESANPETLLEQREIRDSIAHALGKLQPHLREVIVMKNYQHLTFREMAGVTDTPEGTLKARYHRAIALLKEYLEVNHV